MNLETIIKKSEELYPKIEEHPWIDSFASERNAFVEGAKWMLNNLWTSVDEEMPEKRKVVIAHYQNENEVGECFSYWNGYYWVDGSTNELEGVTKWMYIPKTDN